MTAESDLAVKAPKWTVYVDDNFHYMDDSERYEMGFYVSYEDAVAACKGIVDRSLAGQTGRDAKSFFENYRLFGADPFIMGPKCEPEFSAWSYAEQRCHELRPAGTQYLWDLTRP